MSSLIPSYPIGKFKLLKANEIKRLKSCEVTSDGEFLFLFINPSTGFIRDQVEGLAQLSNSNGGEDLEKILGSS